MRKAERIPIVLNFFKYNKEAYLKFANCGIMHWNLFNNRFDEIKQYWEESPDLRFGQLLINLGSIYDSKDVWYKEEVDWLIENNYMKFEDLHFWTSIYDKHNKLLEASITKSLRDLDIDHIRAIKQYLHENGGMLPYKYKEYFDKRIENEENKTN